MRSGYAARAEAKLTEREFANFELMLHEQRSFRIDQLADLASADQAGDLTGSDVPGALEHAARHALAEIDRALDRLRRGSYGQCVDCGKAVGRDRLEVLPAVARCMPCQRSAR